MSKPAWGTKRTCQACAGKYYDLNRTPVVCPKCQAVFDPASGTRLRSDPSFVLKGARARSVFGTAASERHREVEASDRHDETEELEERETENAEAGEDPVEDVSELGDDESDMAEIGKREEVS
jgi:uncharacterized protein (TIGR02300 family)